MADGSEDSSGLSIEQSQRFNSNHRIAENERIEYGFRDAGSHVQFNNDGSPATPPNREIIVVRSPNDDPTLKNAIETVRNLTQSMPSVEQRSQFLKDYIISLLPENDDENTKTILNRFLGGDRSGREISLGQLIEAGTGVCRHRSLLFKVMADELGLPAALVRGRYNEGGKHAWNEVQLENGQRLLVDVNGDYVQSTLAPNVRDNYLSHDKKPMYNETGQPRVTDVELKIRPGDGKPATPVNIEAPPPPATPQPPSTPGPEPINRPSNVDPNPMDRMPLNQLNVFLESAGRWWGDRGGYSLFENNSDKMNMIKLTLEQQGVPFETDENGRLVINTSDAQRLDDTYNTARAATVRPPQAPPSKPDAAQIGELSASGRGYFDVNELRAQLGLPPTKPNPPQTPVNASESIASGTSPSAPDSATPQPAPDAAPPQPAPARTRPSHGEWHAATDRSGIRIRLPTGDLTRPEIDSILNQLRENGLNPVERVSQELGPTILLRGNDAVSLMQNPGLQHPVGHMRSYVQFHDRSALGLPPIERKPPQTPVNASESIASGTPPSAPDSLPPQTYRVPTPADIEAHARGESVDMRGTSRPSPPGGYEPPPQPASNPDLQVLSTSPNGPVERLDNSVLRVGPVDDGLTVMSQADYDDAAERATPTPAAMAPPSRFSVEKATHGGLALTGLAISATGLYKAVKSGDTEAIVTYGLATTATAVDTASAFFSSSAKLAKASGVGAVIMGAYEIANEEEGYKGQRTAAVALTTAAGFGGGAAVTAIGATGAVAAAPVVLVAGATIAVAATADAAIDANKAVDALQASNKAREAVGEHNAQWLALEQKRETDAMKLKELPPGPLLQKYDRLRGYAFTMGQQPGMIRLDPNGQPSEFQTLKDYTDDTPALDRLDEKLRLAIAEQDKIIQETTSWYSDIGAIDALANIAGTDETDARWQAQAELSHLKGIQAELAAYRAEIDEYKRNYGLDQGLAAQAPVGSQPAPVIAQTTPSTSAPVIDDARWSSYFSPIALAAAAGQLSEQFTGAATSRNVLQNGPKLLADIGEKPLPQTIPSMV